MPTLSGFFDRRLAAIFLCLFSVATGMADDWPHWRGSNRNGVSGESSGWSGEDWPGKLLWEAKTESGSSAPIVAAVVVGWRCIAEQADDSVTGKIASACESG